MGTLILPHTRNTLKLLKELTIVCFKRKETLIIKRFTSSNKGAKIVSTIAKNTAVSQNSVVPLSNIHLPKSPSYSSSNTTELKDVSGDIIPKVSQQSNFTIPSKQADDISSTANKIPSGTKPGYYGFWSDSDLASNPSITSKVSLLPKTNYQEIQKSSLHVSAGDVTVKAPAKVEKSSLSLVQDSNNFLAVNDDHMVIKTNSCNSASCFSTNCAKVVNAPCKVDSTLTIAEEITHNLTTYPPRSVDSTILDKSSNACGDERPQAVIRETSETIQNKEIVSFKVLDAQSRWLQEDATYPKIASFLPEKSLAYNNILNNWEDGTQI